MSASESATVALEGTGAAQTSTSTAAAIRERLLSVMPVTESRLELAGISTAVLAGGEGPPLVLLHGPGEHAAKWLRVIPELVRTHRVIAPDLPGHGASDTAGQVPDAGTVLAWLDDLIERTCQTPPALVGQIIGGAIAARFAAHRSDRLRCLVLADALGLAPFQPMPDFGNALTAFLAQPDEETHDRLWQHCAFDLERLRRQLGEHWSWIRSYNLALAQVPSLKAAQQAMMAQFGLAAIPPAELSRISVPTFLIWGRHDLATPLTVAETANRRYGWPLQVIDGAADDPPIEQPEAFVTALRHVLAESATADDTSQSWSRIAAGYDEFVTPTHLWLGEQGLRRAALRPGMRFLDVAAGSGALSIPAARIGAAVVATDHSPIMLQHLAARARKEALAIDTLVMDGHALQFDDNSFDIAGSQFGVMLFPQMPQGISEMARVTRPGGRVLMSVYGDPSKIEFFQFFIAAIKAARPDFTGPPTDPPPLPFQLQDPERLRAELGKAGLKQLRVATITEKLTFSSGNELWAWLTSSNPIVGMVLAELDLTAEEKETAQKRLETMFRDRSAGTGPAVLTNPINIGIGDK